MAKASEIVVGFNGGEVSPNMESRPELEFYARSASVVENSDVLPEGGGKKRGGTEYVADCETYSVASHLKTFSYSDEFSYVLEFSPTKLRIFRVQDKSIVATFDSPYTVAQARDIQIERKNDVMWLVHPEVPEQELKRTGISAFTFEELVHDYPPLLEKDLTGIEMTPGARTGTGVALVASANWFEDNHVGSYIAINQLRLASNIVSLVEYGPTITQTLAATGTTTNSLWTAFSEIVLNTSGTWNGRLSIEESLDGGTSWTEIYFITDTSNAGTGGQQNFSNRIFTGKRPANSILRIRYVKQAGSAVVSLSVNETYNYGLAKIATVTDAQNATIDIVSDFYDTSGTYEWYEGAFNVRNGYARTVFEFDGAKWYWGNAIEPLMVWRSLIDDFYNFKIGTNDDEGIRRRPSAKGTAMFAIAKDELILVTSHGSVVVKAGDNTSTITPSNIAFVNQTGDGSAYQQGELANDAVLFVQKGAKKLRDLIYSEEAKSYVTNDISALAKHITKLGILETSIEKLPEQRVGCVLTNGEIGLVTYERSEGIVSWQRYLTNGNYHSRAVADNGEEDSIWYVVERNGGFIIEIQKSVELDPAWYVDSAVENTTLVACQAADSFELTADPDYHIQVNKVAHGLSDGDKIRFQDVTGYPYLEGKVFTVADKTDDTFILKSEDGTVYVSPYDILPPIITVTECGIVEARGDYEYQGIGNRWLKTRVDRTVDELVLDLVDGWKLGNYEGVTILDAPLADVLDEPLVDMIDLPLDDILDSTLDSEGYTLLYSNPSTFELPPLSDGWIANFSVIVTDGPDSGDKEYAYIGQTNGKPAFKADGPIPGIDDRFQIWSGSFWNINAGPILYVSEHPTSTDDIPPKTGWDPANPGSGTPSVEYSFTTADVFTPPVLSWPGAWEEPVAGTFCQVSKIVSGLDHLEGMEVQVLVEAKKVETHTVENGQVELDEYGSAWIAGLQYKFRLSPLPIEMLDLRSLGHMKTINHVSLKLKDSYGGRVFTDSNRPSDIDTRKLTDPLGEIPELFTGDYQINPEDGWASVKRIYIEQDLPYPFEVLSLSMGIDIQGRA